MQSNSRFLLPVFCMLLLSGCGSKPLGPYVSPRVKGIVVRAETGEPLPRVSVMRTQPGPKSREVPRGGQLLISPSPVSTGLDGKFELANERVLSVFRGAGWNQVRLTFERAGYLRLQTNFSIRAATNVPGTGPLLDVGVVELRQAR